MAAQGEATSGFTHPCDIKGYDRQTVLVPAWSGTQNLGQHLAGGNSSWCPELEVWTKRTELAVEEHDLEVDVLCCATS